MKNILFTVIVLISCSYISFAQKNPESDKTFKEKLEKFGEDLIAQPERQADSNANKLVNDNISIEVNPLWREKGTYTIVQFNLPKTDLSPLRETFPLPEKKIVQSLTINMGSSKKTVADKKAEIINAQKKHLTGYFKDGAIAKSSQEISDVAQGMFIGSEPFTTKQGKSGEINFFQDVESKQSSLIVLMTLPDAEKGITYFCQFNYVRYNYETDYPEDPLEWRTFLYADDQEQYVAFTKGILSTFLVR